MHRSAQLSLLVALLVTAPALAQSEGGETKTLENQPSDARAEPARAAATAPFLYFSHTILASYRTLGVLYDFNAYKRWKLWDRDDVLFKTAHFDAGLADEWTPVYNHVGGYLELEPIAVLKLRVDAYQMTYYRVPIDASYGYLYYPAGESDPRRLPYSESARQKRDQLPATTTTGWRVKGNAELRLMVDRVALLQSVDVNRLTVKPRGTPNEDYWYEPFSDSIHRTTDVDVTYFALLLYQLRSPATEGQNLMIGPTYKHLWVRGTGFNNDRLGVTILFEPKQDVLFLKEPRLACLVLWYLNDPNLKGPLPFVALALSFNTNWYDQAR
jgi:hypothetical protein